MSSLSVSMREHSPGAQTSPPARLRAHLFAHEHESADLCLVQAIRASCCSPMSRGKPPRALRLLFSEAVRVFVDTWALRPAGLDANASNQSGGMYAF